MPLNTASFSTDIFALFSDDASSLEIASVIMIFVAVVSFPEAHAILSAGILRGSGKAAQVAGYSFLSITFLRPLMTAFFLYVLDLGLIGCWCALLLDQIIRASCATVLLYRLEHKGWVCEASPRRSYGYLYLDIYHPAS